MSQKRLKNLENLIYRLSKKEYSNLLSFLGAFHCKGKDYVPKSVIIVELIKKKGNVTLDLLKEVSSPESSDQSFSILLGRVYDKCLESLSLKVNTNQSPSYSDLWRTKFDLTRKLLGAQILLTKSLNKEAESIFKSVSQKAQEYELFDLQIEALFAIMNLCLVKGKAKESESILKSIEIIGKKRDIVNSTKSYYYIDFLSNEWKLFGAKVDQVKNRISSFKTLYQKYPTDNLLFHIYLIDLAYCEYINANTSALKKSFEFLDLVETKPSVRKQQHLWIANLHVSHNLLEMFSFKKAIDFAEKSLELSESGPDENFQLSLEYLFQANFHSKNYLHAFELINKIVLEKESISKSRQAKRRYFRACIYFLRGMHKNCKTDLNETMALDKDRNGWNINIRFLTIMNMVEMNELDLADRAVENLYSVINDLRKSNLIQPRFIEMFKIVNELSKSGYRFQLAALQLKESLAHLKSDKYSARILTPELIAVHKWFLSKIDENSHNSIVVSFAA